MDNASRRFAAPQYLLYQLLITPENIVKAIHTKQYPPSRIRMASLLFAMTSMILAGLLSLFTHALDLGLLIQRFIITALFLGLCILPVFSVLWALLYKLTSWFFDAQPTFKTWLSLASLSIGHLIPVLGIGLFFTWLKPYLPEAFRLLFFLLTLSGMGLSLRLAIVTFCTLNSVSQAKAVWYAIAPFIALGIAFIATYYLTVLAMQSYLGKP
jgi:hypothetical protein